MNTTDEPKARPTALTAEEQATMQQLNEAIDQAGLARQKFINDLVNPQTGKYKGATLLPDGRLRWPATQQPTP
jgi:hypothetical protein